MKISLYIMLGISLSAIGSPAFAQAASLQPLLAEVQRELLPHGAISNATIGYSTNLAIQLAWSPREDVVRYREEIAAFVDGKSDGWNIKPPQTTILLMTDGGVIWWTTLAVPSSHTSWIASLDPSHSHDVATAIIRMKDHALSDPLPADSIQVKLLAQKDGTIAGEHFYLSDTGPIDDILATILRVGTDERLNKDRISLQSRPRQDWASKVIGKWMSQQGVAGYPPQGVGSPER